MEIFIIKDFLLCQKAIFKDIMIYYSLNSWNIFFFINNSIFLFNKLKFLTAYIGNCKKKKKGTSFCNSGFQIIFLSFCDYLIYKKIYDFRLWFKLFHWI